MNDPAVRWRQVAHICDAALRFVGEERVRFLATACGGDGQLRRDVDEFLAHEQTAASFLGTSLDRMAAALLTADAERTLIGRTVSHYHILERLGAGGMGIVYRAEDLKLHRVVALKFLPPDLTRDAEAKRRFMSEARAASALDHPNIGTIYEIDETPDGQLFIAMAYYAGDTVKAKISHGHLAVMTAVDYAIQIAQGLSKAHAIGIIHRDIKPANLIVTEDGLVKIVDFGIAKLLGDATMTRTGTIVGTVAYMSPEQWLGRSIDVRSDLWSVGVVLYEMLAGDRPFQGDHPTALAHAIQSVTPAPVSNVRPDITPDLSHIVDRALAKAPNDRYQTTAELIGDLRGLAAGTPAAIETRSTRAGWAAALVAVFLIVAGLTFARRHAITANVEPLRLTNPTQIAGTVGIETQPSWSHDGSVIAYQSDQSGNNDIWIAQLGGGPPINRTSDFGGGDEMPRISPDGYQIAFWSARDGGGIFLMPLLAGAPRKIAPGRQDVAAAGAWSPDGRELAYPVTFSAAGASPGQPRIEILTLATGATRQTKIRPGFGGGALDMAWSPDGQFLALLRANSYNNQTSSLWVLRLSDQREIALTDNRMIQWSPQWSSDSRTLFFTSNRGGTMDLWQQRIAHSGEPQGPAERLTTGLDILQTSVTADGRKVAYAKGRRIANIWRVPVSSVRLMTWADAQQVTLDQAWIEAFDLSHDGHRLAVQSDRSGNPDIWTMPASGGEMQQLTTDQSPDWWPAWSPDGREIAYYSLRSGAREIWIQPASGTAAAARQLTTAGGGLFPRWSHDARTIFFGSGTISTMSVTGGESHVLVGQRRGGIGTMEFALSPDGQSFVFASGEPAVRRLWRAAASGDQQTALTNGQATAPVWSPDGGWVYFTTSREREGATYQLERPGLNIWRIPSQGGVERPVTNLSGRRGFLGPTIATDGRWLYFTWREDVSDIWTMDIVRK
jgi:Tol biopolymer transport system component